MSLPQKSIYMYIYIYAEDISETQLANEDESTVPEVNYLRQMCIENMTLPMKGLDQLKLKARVLEMRNSAYFLACVHIQKQILNIPNSLPSLCRKTFSFEVFFTVTDCHTHCR